MRPKKFNGLSQQRCERCNELLKKGKEVWLELDHRDCIFRKPGSFPKKFSQGGFPFGKACAAKAINKMVGS